MSRLFEFSNFPSLQIYGDAKNPGVVPRVLCRTKIYHPNIDTLEDEGVICFNLFDDLWTSEKNLEDIVQGLLFLLHNPNLEDPFCCIFSPDMTIEEFEENVKTSIKGGEVDGYEFRRHEILFWSEEEEAIGKGEDDDYTIGEPGCAGQVWSIEDTIEENKALQQLCSEEAKVQKDRNVGHRRHESGDVELSSKRGVGMAMNFLLGIAKFIRKLLGWNVFS